MLFGYREDGTRIHISEYTDGDVFCLDKHPLIAKKGGIRQHHFSHKSNTNCRYNNNKGEWHRCWQDRVPTNMQEIRMVKGDKIHIADVVVGSHVIEYQHSPISKTDIDDRQSFYPSLGYDIIWVFDTSSWSYSVIERRGKVITIVKRTGPGFPLTASYRYPVSKIYDFNKKEVLRVTCEKGNKITGVIMNMMEFDNAFLGTTNSDIRPFHHSI